MCEGPRFQNAGTKRKARALFPSLNSVGHVRGWLCFPGADYVELISYEESMQEGMASDSDRLSRGSDSGVWALGLSFFAIEGFLAFWLLGREGR